MTASLRSRTWWAVILLAGWVFCAPKLAAPQALSFRHAIELALTHSGEMTIASSDQVRVHENYLEARDQFLPQVTVGSGLAATYGFPLSIEGSAPTIVNVNTQQFLINFAQRDFIRAAKQDWKAGDLFSRDKRDQVILETALVYTQLDNVTSSLNLLRQQHEEAGRAEQVVSDRVRAGVDSAVELTKAKLASARVRVAVAQNNGAADVLKARLAQLTGLASDSIQTSTESIPKLPEVRQDENLVGKALQNSPALKIAQEQADSKALRARGQHKMLYPAVDLVAQYGLFSKANHFQDFYKKFSRNNATFGVAIRLPILNSAARAHAEAADAEAMEAKKQAEGVSNQVSSEALKLQRSVEQLAAAREVARLEYELAHSDVEAVGARIQAGTATLKDQESARLAENQRYVALLDAGFQLDKTQMQLLRATGELQQWAMSGSLP
jgi:outer membrane protein TolC